MIGIISVVHVFGQQWSGRQQLDPNGIMSLSWKNEPHQITMELVGKTTGYVGLGISPHGTMKDADLAIGWVENGTPILVVSSFNLDQTFISTFSLFNSVILFVVF